MELSSRLLKCIVSRAQIFMTCASLALLFCVEVSLAEEEKQVVSNSVEVDGISYSVIKQPGSLSLQFGDAKDRGDTTVLPISGFTEKQAESTIHLKLARWWRKGLALIYVMKNEGKYTYSLAVFPSVESGRISPKVWQAEFEKSEVLYQFISIEGQLKGDSVVVILGNLHRNKNGFRKFSQGGVYVEDCPQPPTYFSFTPIEPSSTIPDKPLPDLFLSP